MKKILCACLIGVSLFASTGCEKFLDVNTNPNGPDALLQPELFLPQIQSRLAEGIQWDGRFVAQYTQNWASTAVDNAVDLHGNPLSDSYAQLWKSVYFSMGYNLSDMIESGEKNKKYDFVGVGQIMRAWGWQLLTDYHGEIILTQAFDPSRRTFEYDSQELVFAEVKRLLLEGIKSLERTDGLSPAASGLTQADLIYKGDRQKWIKFAYGLLAMNEHRLTNKTGYNPQVVIDYVNKSLASNADDAAITFTGAVSANASFFGPLRNNMGAMRQTKFVVGLLKGTNEELSDPSLLGQDPKYPLAVEPLRDPRITAMLSPSPKDGEYRGVTPGAGIGEWTVASGERPNTLWNTVSTNTVVPGVSPTYFFNDMGPFPLMTYAQLQFIKAEAEWIKAGKAPSQDALDAYKKGVNAHMDYARQFASDKALYDQRRARYAASNELMPATPAELTLSKIMLQKYISTWGWGFFDTWSDFRRYHYDVNEQGVDDGIAENNVYKGFKLPETLSFNNKDLPAYRARPRYNSEYMWNKTALDKLKANDPEYHTYETWFSKPGQ